MIKSFYSFPISLFLACGLVGCGGSSGEAIDNSSGGKSPQKQEQHSNPVQKPKKKMIKGNFIDAPVWGLEYSCKGQTTETTDENGAFECASLPVTFRVGNVIIGTVADKMPIDNKVFPQDLVGVTRDNIDNANVKKLASFLQTLDDDGDIEGVIKIDENLKKELKDKEEVHLVNLDRTQISKILDKELVKLEDAIKHLKKNIFTDKKPDSIEIKLSKDTLPLGLDGKAVVKGMYSIGDGDLSSIIAKGIIFSSSDENIATIDSDGRIITKKEGSVEIVASYDDLRSTTTLKVSGVALTNIEITKPTLSILTNLAIGRGTRLLVNGSYSNDNLKKDITNQVIWSSKSPLFSGINPRGEYIIASGLGVGSITASLFDLSDTLEFDIKKSDIKKVKIYPREITVPLGKSISASALGYYEDDSNTTYDESNRSIREVAKWSVDDNRSVIYTEDGNLTPNYYYINSLNSYSSATTASGKVSIVAGGSHSYYPSSIYSGLIATKKGDITLSVDYKGLKDSIKVEIIDPEIDSIGFNLEKNYLKVGESTAYDVKAIFTDGNITDIKDKVIVKSLNPAILEVKDGNITALDGGYGFIEAIYVSKDRNITDTISIHTQKLAKPTAISIKLNGEGDEIPVGSGMNMSLNIEYSEGERDYRTPDVNWSVSDATIAKLDDFRYGDYTYILGVKKGEVVVTAKFGSLTATKKIKVVLPSSISIDFGDSDEIIKGERKDLSIKAKYDMGIEVRYDKDDIYWEIDNSEYAKLNVNYGADLVALKEGEVTVTAKVEGLSATKKFKIIGPESLYISFGASNEIPMGEGKNITLQERYSNGNVQYYNGNDAYWEIDDSGNASLFAYKSGNGYLKAIKKGEVTVKATINGSSTSQIFKIIDPIFESIDIVSDGMDGVYIGKSKKFKLVARYSDGSQKDVDDGVEWSVASNAITVDSNGVVIGVKESNSLLIAKYKDKRARKNITIYNLKLDNINGNDYFNFKVGDTKTLEVRGNYNDGTTKKIAQNLTWKSSDESVATVEQNGKVRAVGTGNTQITVKFNGDKSESFYNMVNFEINVQSNTTGATNSGAGA